MIGREAFFSGFREAFGQLRQSQVDGLNALLDAHDREPFDDLRHAAYALATVKRECGDEWKPIHERGGAAYFTRKYEKRRDLGNKLPGDGALFHGRGYVQLTGRANYERAGLADNPDAALDPAIAWRLLRTGMADGWFTGKGLSAYIVGDKCDYVNARRVINGVDKAQEIAGHARTFERILRAATATAPQPAPEPPVRSVPRPTINVLVAAARQSVEALTAALASVEK